MLETPKHYLSFSFERERVILHARGTGSPLEACMIFSSTADFEPDEQLADGYECRNRREARLER
jgi:hypothetical protein